eukprot:11088928-Alexandrium_andersonii.AAC.1
MPCFIPRFACRLSVGVDGEAYARERLLIAHAQNAIARAATPPSRLASGNHRPGGRQRERALA